MGLMRFMLIVGCFLLVLNAAGQQQFTIHGVISKKLSTERVAQVVIHDLNGNEMMMSDELGWFTIKAAVGDTLLFTKQDYTDQKIVVLNGSDMPVYMQPVIKLGTVTVAGQSRKQELNDVMADYRKNGTFYNGKPPLAIFSPFGGAPITGLYELFGKTPREAKRFAAFSKEDLEYAEIRKRYTPALVKKETGAPDSVVVKFMEYYVPTYDDIKKWNDYDLMKQVKRRYDYYLINKEKIRQKDLDLPALRGTVETPPEKTKK